MKTCLPYACGKTVAYFRSGALEFLEALRLSGFDKSATVIQCFIRKQKALSTYRSLHDNDGLLKKKQMKKKKRSMKRAMRAVLKLGRAFERKTLLKQ